MLPETAFYLLIWTTHKEIAVNIELYIRQLMGSIAARRGALENCHEDIEGACWARIHSWPQINEQQFRFP